MKKNIFTNVILVLLSVLSWSCSNNELEEIQNSEVTVNETVAFSRSAGNIDYSQFTLLEKRTIMSRIGQYYNGSITYNGADFPINIYWDPDFEYYNLYAVIDGVVNHPFIPGNVRKYTLQHVATYDSESTIQTFWFVIKCNYIIEYYSDAVEERHVSFRVAFSPDTRSMNYDVLEEGGGLWGDPDRV